MSELDSMAAKGFDYDDLVQNALKSVVKDSLKYVADYGLPGSHHFYITFQTNRPDVKIPDFLREKHPDEITIVLQHQFWDMKVDSQGFEVSLSFNDIQEKICVPFSAIVNFLDPSVKFGLQFTPEDPPKDIPEKQSKPRKKNDKESEKGPHNVVTLDSFRKK
jgi:hypothetical protein